jgi:putative phosphoribosyl transferase
MHAAVAAIKQQQPARVIIAVPVAAAATCKTFATQGDEVICVLKPEEVYAISLWYEHFSQTSDKEVHDLLTYTNHEQPA